MGDVDLSLELFGRLVPGLRGALLVHEGAPQAVAVPPSDLHVDVERGRVGRRAHADGRARAREGRARGGGVHYGTDGPAADDVLTKAACEPEAHAAALARHRLGGGRVTHVREVDDL